jgi:protein-L-isoaspartate(D-aspartate) O-methyltransferase
MDYDIARARLINQLAGEIQDKRVLSAMSRVPRELFVPAALAGSAYENVPLPIGANQTISQPYIVALMTASLELNPQKKVLEIGTGSGYQTAVLAELAGQVVTTERIPELLQKAKTVLERLGYKNIEIHPAAETLGWQDGAVEGRLVIPVGSRYEQVLHLIIKHPGGIEDIDLGGCRFVSLIGKDAWEG